jgi:uncharacterized membrane protein YeaQ/YmgE (transglycosylase-associated protein family)
MDEPLHRSSGRGATAEQFSQWLLAKEAGVAAARRSIGMSIIAWIILGLISGFIASKIVNKSGEGLVLDLLLGIVGALVGGFLFSLVGATGVNGFNLWSVFVAVIGAIVVLAIKHAVVGRRHVAT